MALTAAGTGSSVTGGGTITFGASVEHVSVNVVGASGRAVFHDNTASGNVTGQIDITCVNIVENVATLGGTVTRSNRRELEGFEALFQIVDNGEGSSGTDFMSPVLFHAVGTTEATCLVPGEQDLAPVRGNFRVEP